MYLLPYSITLKTLFQSLLEPGRLQIHVLKGYEIYFKHLLSADVKLLKTVHLIYRTRMYNVLLVPLVLCILNGHLNIFFKFNDN